SHTAPPLPDRRGGPVARPEREDEPAPAERRLPHRADRRPARRHDRLGRDRPRAARAPREGRAVRGGAVRGDRPGDGIRGSLHRPRRPGSRPPRDAARADVGRPCAGIRPRGSADRGRGAGEPRPPRHCGHLEGGREGLPLALGQLVAARPDAQGTGPDDRRRRIGGARGMTGFLALEDGTVFRGESVGAEGFAFGEAVFTTAMTGYQEVVTDPSYAEQIVCFTAPMIGNYGVAPGRCESPRPHARAVVMREARGPAWTDWLHEHGVVALSGIDTRSLVIHLRASGAMRAIAVAGEGSVEEAVAATKGQPAMAGRSLASAVSAPDAYVFSDAGAARIAVVDYGCKRSILDRLAWAGAAVTVYPHDADPDELAGYDGVLLSNGPGDPAPLADEVETVRALLGR